MDASRIEDWSEFATLPLTIQLFGRMVIRANGVPLPPLRSRKGMWLVALLALRARKEVSREWLAVSLWPDSDDPLSNLRRTLTDLRQAMGELADCLETLPGRQIRLSLGDEAIDVLEFDRAASGSSLEELERAIALYQGPLLEECDEEWVIPEREVRLSAFLQCAEKAANLHLRQRQPAEAVACLRSALAAAPLRESLCCNLMQALAQCGKSSEAILEYHQLRQRLRRELNAEPSAATVACYRQLLSEGRQKAQSKDGEKSTGAKAVTSRMRVPHPLTELIGREGEICAIESGFSRSRLVTLTGGGGIGKTRLAIAAAHSLNALFSEGIWFVELARVSDASLVPQAIATTLKVHEAVEISDLEAAVAFLAKRAALLVLDNCEHLIDRCAQVVETLLQHCPHVSLLATSRQPLGLNGEIRVSVPPLTVTLPSRGASDSDPVETTLRDSSAIRLFVERATTVLPSFRLTPQNLPAIRQLCLQLEGIPLALEMAAVRVKLMSVEQIAARLKDRFRLLSSGNRPDQPHHQTLRSLLDWSHDLLSDSERTLLRRLAVFVGGWTLEAAETVCADDAPDPVMRREHSDTLEVPRLLPEEVLDFLGMLVEKSLVQSEDEGTGELRFRMLETLREYALEKLDVAGETLAMQRQHRDHYARLASEAFAHMQDKEQRFWLETLDREYDNIRAALHFCQQDPDSGEVGLRLASCLGDFWWIRGYLREGRAFVEKALNHPGVQTVTALRAQAIGILGVLASNQGNYVDAERCLQESQSLLRSLGQKRLAAIMLGNLGSLYRDLKQYDQAHACLEESLALFREMNLPANAVISLTNLAGTWFQQGEYARARECYQEAVALRRQLGNPRGVAIAQCGLGQTLMLLGETEEAIRCFEEAEAVFREVNDRANLAITLHSISVLLIDRNEFDGARARVLEALEVCRDSEDILIVGLLKEMAELFNHQGDTRKAVLLLGASEAYARLHDMALSAGEQENVETLKQYLRMQLGDSAYQSAWEEGSSLSLEEAISLAN